MFFDCFIVANSIVESGDSKSFLSLLLLKAFEASVIHNLKKR